MQQFSPVRPPLSIWLRKNACAIPEQFAHSHGARARGVFGASLFEEIDCDLRVGNDEGWTPAHPESVDGPVGGGPGFELEPRFGFGELGSVAEDGQRWGAGWHSMLEV